MTCLPRLFKGSILAASLCATFAFADERVVRDVTVCEIVEAPARFLGVRVVIDGQLRSDAFEFMDIADARCPGVALALSIRREVELNDGGVRKLYRALASGDRVGTFDKTIRARFQGTVVRGEEDVPFLILDVESVSRISVSFGN